MNNEEIKYIYRTKLGTFETNKQTKIPLDKLHSPDENIPALETSLGTKMYYQEGKEHRLSGPALILDAFEEFWLEGKRYEFNEWILNHPNIDIYLDAIGMTDLTEKIIWKLQNI